MDASGKLRIALVPPLWARVAPSTSGGVEYIVYLLAQEFTRRGHEVTVFTSRDSATTARIAAITASNMIDEIQQGRVWEYQYYESCSIAEALRGSRAFDIVHFHVGAHAIPFGELSPVPALHTLHNPVTPDALWVLERYPEAAVTSVSRRQIAVVPENRRATIRTIHNACNFDDFEFSGLPGEYLAFLGRMGPGKSPLNAIWIARDAGMPILLAGEPLDAEERVYFSTFIEPLIEGRTVRYIGSVDQRQKVKLLAGAAALLFPVQAEEAFGLVMIEAMACGTPVIAIRKNAVEEVIDYGQTGFYADTAQALAPLVPAALSLDRAGVRDHARARFHYLRMADEYLCAYDALLGGAWNRPPLIGSMARP